MLLFWWHNENWRLNLDNILIDEKSHQNILVYNILYQSLIDSKPLCTRYLKSFGSEKYEYINPF